VVLGRSCPELKPGRIHESKEITPSFQVVELGKVQGEGSDAKERRRRVEGRSEVDEVVERVVGRKTFESN